MRLYKIMVEHTLILFFFFNDTATTEIYTLSLHDALPILSRSMLPPTTENIVSGHRTVSPTARHEPTTKRSARLLDRKSTPSELQSRQYLVCRLLLEKKKNQHSQTNTIFSYMSHVFTSFQN